MTQKYFYIKSKLSTAYNVLLVDTVQKKVSQGTKLCIENFHPGPTQKWFLDNNGYLRNAAAPHFVVDISGVKGPDLIL